ncbi:hypothetical protein EGW08_023593 [Elysia chlorotica]|uniref:Uncharacterized protein n=1 Tax=Elysia chlorotica TaxID=188477 RepID=A0A433SIA4_ELYCH|nr:hypothetical protein EGW08_023593 [Elysia chlorotica]
MSTNSSSKLWRLHDEIQANVRSLENLGVDGATYGVVLTPLVLHQLPAHIRLEWARVGEEQEGNLSFLLDFLHNEIRRRERSQTFEQTLSSTGIHAEYKKCSHRGKTGMTAAILSGGSEKNSRTTCVFCKRGHFSDQCPDIKDISLEERKHKIMKLGLCFICLGNQHLARNCQRHCYFCKGKHHAILCQKRSSNKAEPERGNTVRKHSTAGHDVDDINHIGVSYSNSQSMSTVMQVVHTQINGVDVNVMFDSGSDRSFVTTACANKLGLMKVGKENISYCCFAEEERVRETEMKDIFEMKVNCKIPVKLIGMNVICRSMYRSSIPHDVLNAFTGVPFEEDYRKGRPVEIDILIGLDSYWSLMGKNIVKSSCGLVAQETSFGWMLSGVWYMSGKNDGHNRNNTFMTRSLFCQTGKTAHVSEADIRMMWNLDSIGIGPEESEEDKMLDNFNKEIKWNGERYTVKLPWKDDSYKKTLMNNKSHALSRLNSLSKRLNKNPDMKARYDATSESPGQSGELPLFHAGVNTKICCHHLTTTTPS